MCIYYLKISAHTSQKNAHPLYIDRPGTNAIHCQTQKNRRNALCGRNVEILKPTQVHSVSSNTANVSLLLITLVRVRTHARTHTHRVGKMFRNTNTVYITGEIRPTCISYIFSYSSLASNPPFPLLFTLALPQTVPYWVVCS